jgi:3-methyladenine DNA glycosylase AlkC
MQIETKRKGSRSTKDIPADIMQSLNKGEIETANLVEWLAVDQQLLLNNLLKQTGREKYLPAILADIKSLQKQTVNTINEAIGKGLLKQAVQHKDKEIINVMANHTSDCVRCWACYTIGKNTALSPKQMFVQIKPFAADTHFGVREISWLAVRQTIANHLTESLKILTNWATDPNENIRRFASEATRPRGVWCEHIETLKQNPELGLTILNTLKNDKVKYVQDSVGNLLNDASKTQPKFVTDLCKQWSMVSKTKETAYVIKKALRTIEK